MDNLLDKIGNFLEWFDKWKSLIIFFMVMLFFIIYNNDIKLFFNKPLTDAKVSDIYFIVVVPMTWFYVFRK